MKSEKLRRALPWIVLGGVYALLLVFFALFGSHHLYADLSTDMVMAKFLNGEGALISQNLWYTTELRMFNVVNVYQLGMLLFPNDWHLVRLFAVAVMLAGMTGAFLYLGRAAGLKQAHIWGAAVLMLPVSYYYVFVVTYGLAYVGYETLAFLQAGLVLRLSEDGSKGARHWLKLLLLILIALAGGLQGMRMVMLSAAPTAAAMLALFILRAVRSKSFRELLKTREMKLLLYAIINAAAVLAGYLVNAKLLTRSYSYQTFDAMLFNSLSFEGILKQLDYLGKMLGTDGPLKSTAVNGVRTLYAEGQGGLSLGGMLTAVAGVLTIFLLVTAAVMIIRSEKLRLTVPQKAFAMLTAVSVAMGILINTLTGMGGGYSSGACYYMVGVMLLMVSGFFLLEKLDFASENIRTAAMTLLFCVFFALAFGTLRSENLPKHDTAYEKAADWLVENDYTEGYSPFWSAAVLTECSDGRVEMWSIPYLNMPESINCWGQAKAHDWVKPQGRTFFFYIGEADSEEAQELMRWMGREPEWADVEDGLVYMIYADENTEALYAPMRAALTAGEEETP